MTEAFATSHHGTTTGAIRVTVPCRGDRLSSALHAAFDGHDAMPDDFAALLAKLDRVERRPH